MSSFKRQTVFSKFFYIHVVYFFFEICPGSKKKCFDSVQNKIDKNFSCLRIIKRIKASLFWTIEAVSLRQVLTIISKFFGCHTRMLVEHTDEIRRGFDMESVTNFCNR